MFLQSAIILLIINQSAQFSLDQLIQYSKVPSSFEMVDEMHKRGNEMEQTETQNEPPMFRIRREKEEGEEKRKVQTIMNRICLMCHELKSHIAPNTRVECHSNCFQNSVFHSCMKLFSGVPPKTARSEPTAPVPLYSETAET
ncbi:unnamed protein product [Caenorhabditis angaria]|uniref:Uncharacterized protein n=1 Tax=Caenorhabditis angaria TaxID=860376 RepID=A0A9P1J3A1_9PELO|nr:unnamed protein product [Caenorhabditis angaria]